MAKLFFDQNATKAQVRAVVTALRKKGVHVFVSHAAEIHGDTSGAPVQAESLLPYSGIPDDVVREILAMPGVSSIVRG